MKLKKYCFTVVHVELIVPVVIDIFVTCETTNSHVRQYRTNVKEYPNSQHVCGTEM